MYDTKAKILPPSSPRVSMHPNERNVTPYNIHPVFIRTAHTPVRNGQGPLGSMWSGIKLTGCSHTIFLPRNKKGEREIHPREDDKKEFKGPGRGIRGREFHYNVPEFLWGFYTNINPPGDEATDPVPNRVLYAKLNPFHCAGV